MVALPFSSTLSCGSNEIFASSVPAASPSPMFTVASPSITPSHQSKFAFKVPVTSDHSSSSISAVSKLKPVVCGFPSNQSSNVDGGVIEVETLQKSAKLALPTRDIVAGLKSASRGSSVPAIIAGISTVISGPNVASTPTNKSIESSMSSSPRNACWKKTPVLPNAHCFA